MKKLFILLLLFSYTKNFAQNDFKKGYIINNEGLKVDCLIRDQGWMNNPVNFYYKLNEDSSEIKGQLSYIQEFGIYNNIKYIRETVLIDRSSSNINSLSTLRDPNFKEQTLFLKHLIAGEANLYQYIDGELNRYFYDIDNGNIEQLVHKKYKTLDNNIAENNSFKQQLYTDLKCNSIKLADIEKLRYSKNSLTKIFAKYNLCKQVNFREYFKESVNHSGDFNFRIKLGGDISSMKINKGFNADGLDFSNNLSFRGGVETEYVLPYNNNKLSVFSQFNYRYFKDSKSYFSTYPTTLNIDYISLEILIGFRYYSFLKNNSKIFIDGGLVVDIPFNSKIEFDIERLLNNPVSDNFSTTPSANLGLGYELMDKYSVEIRYSFLRKLEDNVTEPSKYTLLWDSNFSCISVVLGYKLF